MGCDSSEYCSNDRHQLLHFFTVNNSHTDAMADKHLNLFYTYNRDSELIENNLTRAFIVLVSILTDDLRERFLSNLLERAGQAKEDISGNGWDFSGAQFALQSNIKRRIPREAKTQVLLTIGSEHLTVESILEGDSPTGLMQQQSDSEYTSIPDAWITGPDNDYCILIEAKTGTYPLDIDQLEAHARDWFGVSLTALLQSNALLSLTWMDVLEALNYLLTQAAGIESSEQALIRHFIEFLKYYGYYHFDGIELSGLQPPPFFRLTKLPTSIDEDIDLTLSTLKPPPDFTLAIAL